MFASSSARSDGLCLPGRGRSLFPRKVLVPTSLVESWQRGAKSSRVLCSLDVWPDRNRSRPSCTGTPLWPGGRRVWQAVGENGPRGTKVEEAGSARCLPHPPAGLVISDRHLNPGAPVSLSVSWRVELLPSQGRGDTEIRCAHGLSGRPASTVGGTPYVSRSGVGCAFQAQGRCGQSALGEGQWKPLRASGEGDRSYVCLGAGGLRWLEQGRMKETTWETGWWGLGRPARVAKAGKDAAQAVECGSGSTDAELSMGWPSGAQKGESPAGAEGWGGVGGGEAGTALEGKADGRAGVLGTCLGDRT